MPHAGNESYVKLESNEPLQEIELELFSPYVLFIIIVIIIKVSLLT